VSHCISLGELEDETFEHDAITVPMFELPVIGSISNTCDYRTQVCEQWTPDMVKYAAASQMKLWHPATTVD
jgi:hypothetical protein